MKVSLKMIKDMAREPLLGLTVEFTKEVGLKENNTDLESLRELITNYVKENGQKEKELAWIS